MAKSRILLVNPRVINRRIPPIGICYIAAVLEENGLDVRILDPIPSQLGRGFDYQREIRRHRPDVVGLTCVTPQLPEVLRIARLVKDIDRDIITVVGGVHPTSRPSEMLSDENIDIVVIGEGEYAMLELARAMERGSDLKGIKGLAFKRGEAVVFTPRRALIRDLDDLPLPARHLLPMRWYTERSSVIRGSWLRCATMATGRGCPFKCVFCAQNALFGRVYRQRTPEPCVDEMELLRDRYKIEGMLFLDDVFTLNKKGTIEICREMRRRKLDIVWECQTRVDTISKSLLLEMRKAGCLQIEFGFESGSQKVLDTLNKGATVEQAKRAAKLCKEVGLSVIANFIIGNPGETLEDIEKTRRLAREIDARHTEFYYLTPYPGTKLFDIASEKGWLKGMDQDSRDWIYSYMDVLGQKPVMEIDFKRDELVRIRRELCNEFWRSDLRLYLSQPHFLRDAIKAAFAHPRIVLRGLRSFVKTRGLADIAWGVLEAQRR